MKNYPVLLVCFLLASCVTSPDTPMRMDVSIWHQKISENRYAIQVKGAPAASAKGIEYWFHKRATELAKGMRYEFWLKVDEFDSTQSGVLLLGPVYTPYKRQLPAFRGSGGIRVLSQAGGNRIEVAPPDDLDAFRPVP